MSYLLKFVFSKFIRAKKKSVHSEAVVDFRKREDSGCPSALPVVLYIDSALRGFMFRGSGRHTITLYLIYTQE